MKRKWPKRIAGFCIVLSVFIGFISIMAEACEAPIIKFIGEMLLGLLVIAVITGILAYGVILMLDS